MVWCIIIKTTNIYTVKARPHRNSSPQKHYDDVIMSAIASQITSLTVVYSTIYPGADQSKHQSSASLAFVWGIHRGPVNSPHKWPVTRKMFPFGDVIMTSELRITDPWGGKSTSDRRIPLTKGQQHRGRFHVMASSCNRHFGLANSQIHNKMTSRWLFNTSQ